jgi:hypothetical protein
MPETPPVDEAIARIFGLLYPNEIKMQSLTPENYR